MVKQFSFLIIQLIKFQLIKTLLIVSVDPILHNYFTHLNFYGVEVVPPAPPLQLSMSKLGRRAFRADVQSLKQDLWEKLTHRV